ncbi:MCE family protein [Mycobacterium sp. CBMA293]|uniref:MCE family protein n=1 Tax=unclassified Mycolicibacterium TaxID=2636767 RepID=UPI0012DD3BE8|nr:MULTISPECIES: MCE family protein [unclassified Mycolicibacterium]MUL46312.1 MCE family protein [Mycolicibacterium sp. CBMA 360]MUL57176.1 MCE family protein [Mycolicibacterium sp. CBMA 335]MUL70216.1 MCE family protein [Mycolicibacterium sp. CBMA 311]MUL92264.1 MCE family protein [Mycolicibacterium sp. CBMA 230]MUM04804.1 MCE-family protein MCE3A [Mycolicibacterium sp. CBMA 213]
MTTRRHDEHRLHSGWWALILVSVLAVFSAATIGAFSGIFRTYIPVTLTSDRAGLVMDAGARVKMRGVQVGRVGTILGGNGPVQLRLEIDPDQVANIPANVGAQIAVTTAFGSKFVDLIPPAQPSAARLASGAVLISKNVSTEVNTVFENVVDLLKMVDPAKLNAVLTAVADGVRGQGTRMGQAATGMNEVLTALNARNDTFRQDWRSFKNFNDTYNAVAQDIVTILDTASTTSTTVVKHASQLDELLINTLGFARSGTNLLASSKDSFINAVNTLEPTTELLNKYSPVYTCFLQGATWFLNHGGYDVWGGNGKSIQLDVALLGGNDPYGYPDNLPVVAAKGGPGGQPSCGSLPDPTKNFPVRQLITDTGWGTGLDDRPNPGIGHPCYADYFPVTRAVPEAPTIRQCLPGPAPGPTPPPGSPPFGAPFYGADGASLWPNVPPATTDAAPTPPAPAADTAARQLAPAAPDSAPGAGPEQSAPNP